jgi:L-rhamnose isomerase
MISELALHDSKRKIDFLDAILNRIAAWLERKAGQLGAEERQKVLLHASTSFSSVI